MTGDPRSGVSADTIPFDEAFMCVLDVIRGDRDVMDDAAWHEADKRLRSALEHGELIAYTQGPNGIERVDPQYWHPPALVPGTADDEGIFFRPDEFPPWLDRISGKERKKAGPKPKPFWPDVQNFVFERMNYHGDFTPEDPEWNCQAQLEKEVTDFLAARNLYPVESTIRGYVGKFYKEWKADN